MQVIDNLSEMMHVSSNWKQDKKIGFVPTMGALHQGHLELVKEALNSCDITVVSIFVNPAQFGPNEDFHRYPKTFEDDYTALKTLGVDYLFMPTDNQMYPSGYCTWISLGKITESLCGASRPGHFTGVATIVLKLINLVKPTLMFMGEKDFQQIIVLETMINDLNLETKIVRCPIVRSDSGLALSSRNRYLSTSELTLAPKIYQTMLEVKKKAQNEDKEVSELTEFLIKKLEELGFKIDYVEFVDSKSLDKVDIVQRGNRLILAVYLGKTRLIDNIEI